MLVTRLRLRDFRSYASADVELGAGITVVHGANGAGKTNPLEALYVGCTGRSCRTNVDRELVRFGAPVARVELTARGEDGDHAFAVGVEPGTGKRLSVDGAAVERLVDVDLRPLAVVFLPDRLELVKGPAALRRSHLDQLVAALWPSRAETRRRYGHALAQRNALLRRLRAGYGARESLAAWDAELARHGCALIADRRAAAESVRDAFAARAADLGLDGEPALAYRPCSQADEPAVLEAELADRVALDVERGVTCHGPHRDELAITRVGRELRTYGSQGQQRLALLALLLAEREALLALRGQPPLMLLDDVLSELDPDRRERLVELLGDNGQSVITTADAAQLPAEAEATARVAVANGTVLRELAAA